MHIVLVNRWYPPHTGWGGVAAYNFYLGHALAKLGHSVTVVASRLNENTPQIQHDDSVTVHRLLDREHYYLGKLPYIGRYARPYFQLMYSRRVAHFLGQLERQGKHDIIEFAEINAEGFAYLRQSRRLPVVVRCHTPTFILKRYYTSREMPFDTIFTGKMEEFCIHQADALSAPSFDMARSVSTACNIEASRFIVIPNPLDTSLYALTPEVNSNNHHPITILYVGRLERVKGIEILAHAIPKVLKEVPNSRFVFIGADRSDGEGSTWRTRLEKFFLEQGLLEHVLLLGDLSQQELLSWYRKVDIAVVPSLLYESFSYTCAQAMAAGLAVMASDIGGISETIDQAGILIDPGDVSTLIHQLVRLVSDADERRHYQQLAKSRSGSYFDSAIVANQTVDFYSQLLTSKR